MLHEDNILPEPLPAGDKSLLINELFSLHYRRLVMEAYYLLKEEQDAKDLVQEVFIDLWRKQDLAAIASVKAYLTQAVRNRCLNTLKASRLKEQKQKGYQYTVSSAPPSTDAEEADFAALQQQRADSLQQAILELPPQTARIFQLYYMEKKSRNDVANEMGVSINTIKTVLSRALQFLRKKTQGSVTRLPD